MNKRYYIICVLLMPGNTLWGKKKDDTLVKYRVYCITENKNKYSWAAEDEPPTQCPKNSTHTINPNSITIVKKRASNEVIIDQEVTPTGGHYRVETCKVDITAGPDVVSTSCLAWPFNISIVGVSFISLADMEGDLFTIYTKSDVGTITSDVSAGDTVINIDQSAIDPIEIGYHIELDDGTSQDDLGRVVAIDEENNTITVETAAVNSFNASNSPTVRRLIKFTGAYEIGPPGCYHLLKNKTTAIHLPTNTEIHFGYTNKTANTKKIVFDYEYLY